VQPLSNKGGNNITQERGNYRHKNKIESFHDLVQWGCLRGFTKLGGKLGVGEHSRSGVSSLQY